MTRCDDDECGLTNFLRIFVKVAQASCQVLTNTVKILHMEINTTYYSPITSSLFPPGATSHYILTHR